MITNYGIIEGTSPHKTDPAALARSGPWHPMEVGMHPQSTLHTCSIDGCGRPVRARGWCIYHYNRWREKGDPLAPHQKALPRGARSSLPPFDRFWAKVDKNGPIPEYNPALGPCWVWLAGTTADGYGQFHGAEVSTRAHRIAYEWLVGPIPASLVCDHLCRVRACVNPSHIELVTNKENLIRGYGPTGTHARATHCKYGHPFSEENTYRYRGKRVCLICMKAAQKDYYDRKHRTAG